MKSLQRSPDFGTICERLGLTEAQALNRASRQFEKVKLDFTGPSAEDVFCISIVPLKGLAVKPQLVTLTNQDMESFFKPVIDGVIEGIEAQLMDGSKASARSVGAGNPLMLATDDPYSRRARSIDICQRHHRTSFRRQSQAIRPDWYGRSNVSIA